MAEPRILCEKTDLILTLVKKSKEEPPEVITVSKSRIRKIEFDRCVDRLVFVPIPSEKITIYTPAKPEPIVFTKFKNPQFFEQYKIDLQEFAQTYDIPLVNNLPEKK